METRKIQKVGRSTLTVSLPKEWVNLADVKNGDAVYLDLGRDGVLRILSEALVEKKTAPQEYSINCDLTKKRKKLLERLIVSSYSLGIDTIKLFSSSRIASEQIEEVRNIVRRLIGLSIIEMSRKEIILQCFLETGKLQIYHLIRKLATTTITMLDEAMEALLQFDTELARDVIKREDEANSLYWLITRLVLSAQRSQSPAKELGLNAPFDPTDVRVVSTNLERIADCSDTIAKIAIDLQKRKDSIDEKQMRPISHLNQIVKEVFQTSIEGLFSEDVIITNDAINFRKMLDAEVEDLLRKATIPYFPAIAIMLAMIAENSANIAAVAMSIQIGKSILRHGSSPNSFEPELSGPEKV